MKPSQSFILANGILLILLGISGINPFDRTTWILEVLPIFIILPILWISYIKSPLTTLVYIFIFVHACILMLGGKYSYARVPLGFQIEDLLHLSRNPYDKIGHFFQGFTPVLVAREILIKGNHVQGKKMLIFIPICIVMFISSSYELIEWFSAIMLGQGADEFLGTQGDMWDTQSDMLFALIGSIVALVCFSRIHNKQLKINL